MGHLERRRGARRRARRAAARRRLALGRGARSQPRRCSAAIACGSTSRDRSTGARPARRAGRRPWRSRSASRSSRRGDVRHARRSDRPLFDALTCLRHHTTLDAAGRKLAPNAERHLLAPAEWAHRFADRPAWLAATRAVAERCAFRLGDLGYRFPTYPTAGESQSSMLRRLTFQGARARYGHRFSSRARRQIEHELRVIEKLDLAGYFLIVWDIARYARERRMLAQGRGSAANSAVCYALGITAVDPVGMELLFERFLSEERGEWPDIDIDLPSGDQREDVIQYVFDRYGARGAAMTANVITYRTRLAVREMGKVLGLEADAIDRLAKVLDHARAARGRRRDRRAAAPGRRRSRGAAHPAPARARRPRARSAAPSRPALGRHRDRRRATRRSGADRARVDARSPRRAVGQGRLRRPRHHQDRPARPRHAQRARAHHPARARARGRRDRSRAAARRRPRHLRDDPARRHHGHLPDREPRADGDAAAHEAEALLRPRRRSRDHPARSDRREDGASLSEPARRPRARRVSAPVARTDPAPHPRRPALPGTTAATRDDGGRFHRRRSRGAAPRDGLQALAGAHAEDRDAPARRHERPRHHRRRPGRHRARHHVVRALRLPRIPRRQLRPDRLRIVLLEAPPPRGVPRRSPQRLADGLLLACEPRQGRPTPRRRSETHRRRHLEVALRPRTPHSGPGVRLFFVRLFE